MQTDDLDVALKLVIEDRFSVEVDTLISSRFSTLFLAPDWAFKVRREQPSVITGLRRQDVQRLTLTEYKRGKAITEEFYQELIQLRVFGRSYWMLRMRRMPDAALFANILRNRTMTKEHCELIATALVELQRHSPSVLRYSSDDLEQTFGFLRRAVESVSSRGYDTDSIRDCINKLTEVARAYQNKLSQRSHDGLVIDTHGDLHAGNIFLTDRAYFIDPAVAHPSMYILDYLNQVADVCVDVTAAGYPAHACSIREKVTGVIVDQDVEELLSIYFMPLRALIRVVLHLLYLSADLPSPISAPVIQYLRIAHV